MSFRRRTLLKVIVLGESGVGKTSLMNHIESIDDGDYHQERSIDFSHGASYGGGGGQYNHNHAVAPYYPPQGGYPTAAYGGFPRPGGFPSHGHGGYPPAGYPAASHHSSQAHSCFNGMQVGGGAGSMFGGHQVSHGSHHLSHGHGGARYGHGQHGKFEQQGKNYGGYGQQRHGFNNWNNC